MNSTTRLMRSSSDRLVAGVCGGLARYFGVDALIIRGLFVLLLILPPPALLLYLVLWVIMPLEGSQLPTRDVVKQNVGEIKHEATRLLDRLGLRRQSQPPATWRYDPYTGQPIQRDQQPQGQQAPDQGGQS